MAAGTGFAAAFGAPIGGVLFALEEMSTHFPLKMLWRCLLSNTLGCFTILFLTTGSLFSGVSERDLFIAHMSIYGNNHS